MAPGKHDEHLARTRLSVQIVSGRSASTADPKVVAVLWPSVGKRQMQIKAPRRQARATEPGLHAINSLGVKVRFRVHKLQAQRGGCDTNESR